MFECENTRHISHELPRYYTFRSNMFTLTSLLSSEEPSVLKVIYHPLYSMNKFVTNKSKFPQDGTQVFPYMGVIGYHVTLWEGHMIANHLI